MRKSLTAFALFVASLQFAAPLAAQQRDSGTVRFTVGEPMGPVSGAQVRAAGRNATTNAEGVATLRLPVGSHTVSFTRIGYTATTVTVVIVADSTLRVNVEMAMAMAEMEEVKVSAARTEKLASQTPVRVEVIDEMEVEENTLMAPSGITMLLNETPGIRVLAASPTLGTGSVRILGLPGQYTAMLADGLPLYGGSSSALGPLDISPVDLQRVEIIKGAASSLYGGQALGGVINLVSKPPTGRSEILLNRRTMGVADAATWLSRRLSEEVGISLLASGTLQTAQDMDHDGWAEQPKASRWGIRPRLVAVDARGRSLFVTAGFGYDDRNGGVLANASHHAGTFREGLKSQRADFGARAMVPKGDSGSIAVRVAASTNWRTRRFGAGPVEDDRTTTGFLELTRSAMIARSIAVFGAAVQFDEFGNELNPSYDYEWVTPSLFVTAEREFGRVTASASVRGDAHPDAGFQLTERIAALVKPAEEWSVRASFGTGFAPPSATTEETQAIGLRAIRAGADLRRERSWGTMLDVSGTIAGAELLVTGYRSTISNAIQLVDAGDGSGEALLQHATSDTRISGVETAAVWRFGWGKFLATYGYSRGTRPDAATGVREAIPLLPRHRVGGDLMFEKPGKYRGGIEGIWYGVQELDENPYRVRSKPYLYTMALIAYQFGRFEVVANFENLLNVKQSDTHPLVLPSPAMGGRWTTDVWAPLEGFMANAAVRYRW